MEAGVEKILEMVRGITVFLLIANILGNLSGRESYRKYFSYVTGLVIIVLFLSPVISFITGKNTMFLAFGSEEYKNRKEELMRELEVVSETSEQALVLEYESRVGEQILALCRNHRVNCDVKVELSEMGEIEKITLFITNDDMVPSQLVGEIATSYQVDEDIIWIERV